MAKVNLSNSCSTMLIFGIGKGFLINLSLTSPKLLSKHTVLFFFGVINKGLANAGCRSNTPSLTSLSTSLTRVSSCIFSTGKAWPWYGDTPSFSWKETSFVFQSPKVPSKSDSYFLRSYSNFFCWLALRCLQLSLTTDWRSTTAVITIDPLARLIFILGSAKGYLTVS